MKGPTHTNFTKLPEGFYQRSDVIRIAKDLIGKVLVTHLDGKLTSGRIVETEAYAGVKDKASHAYGGRRTTRTEVMYAEGGRAYVYLCYGIHFMFNVVTHGKDSPHAILIRGVEPLDGIPFMLARTGKIKGDKTLGRGPGNVCKALGINTEYTGYPLLGDQIYILDDGYRFPSKDVVATPRIGVDYAGEDALLPYRFAVEGHAHVSGKKSRSLS